MVLLLAVGGKHDVPASVDAAAPATATTKQPEEWQNELVAWLVSKPGGSFSNKVMWQREGSTGPYAMHAIDDIDQGETLMVIPQAAMIVPSVRGGGCESVQRMMDEYDKGPKSGFYPYMKYLFDGQEGGTKPGLLPTSWSAEAKELLRMVTAGYSGLLPDSFDLESAVEQCNFDGSVDGGDPVREKRREDAYLYMISRSWSGKMVPILDMINHRNGNWFNVESTTAHAGRDIEVYAVKPIKKGDQLYNSYNECNDLDCEDIKYTYVTQHILVDYGFVEDYPRRWMFEIHKDGIEADGDIDDEDFETFVADVDEDPETPGKITLKWHFATPNELQVPVIEEDLKKLKSMEDQVTKGVASLSSDHEKKTILDLYHGYIEVFELALIHRDDEVVDEPDEEEDEL